MHWSTSPFATRLLDDRGTRMTLTRSELKTGPTGRSDVANRRPVPLDEWHDGLVERFGFGESFPPERLIKPAETRSRLDHARSKE